MENDLRPSKIITREALTNAIRVHMAIGGSTNAVLHLMALAGRLGVPLGLEDFDKLSRTTPCIVNLKPSGDHLMEDLYYAGGIPAVMREIQHLLLLDAVTVNGKTVGENIRQGEVFDRDVIRPREKPLYEQGGTVVLRGNLAPGGALLKQTAASPELLQHRGSALVFRNREEMFQRIDDPALPVTSESVLVLKHAGPIGGSGHAGMGPRPRYPRSFSMQAWAMWCGSATAE